jgi:hypothetical protein
MARLNMLLDQLEFGRMRNGALWAKLGDDVTAMNFAGEDGRVTLGEWLNDNPVLEREIANMDVSIDLGKQGGKRGSILPHELWQIAELMERDPKLRSVTIKDVRGKDANDENFLLRSLVEKSSRSTL